MVPLTSRPVAPHRPWAPAVKRALDIGLALCAFALLLPALLLIAALIAFDSPGPVLFRQVRVGRGGEPFLIYKFRTMVVGASKLAANVSPRGDPRVTRVGGFLRRRYLDELPQLINVLRGDMSLVGPRPETPEFVALYGLAERRVLSVRPGVMGPSTLGGMDEEERLADTTDALGLYISTILPERLAADLGYVDGWTVAGDLRLLGAQVTAVLRRMW